MVLRVALGCDYLWYGAYVVMPLVYRLVCLFVGGLVICLCWVCLFCACGCLGCLVRGLVWWFFCYLLVLLILVVGYLLGCYLLVIILIVVLAGDLCFDVALLFARRFVLFVAVCGALCLVVVLLVFVAGDVLPGACFKVLLWFVVLFALVVWWVWCWLFAFPYFDCGFDGVWLCCCCWLSLFGGCLLEVVSVLLIVLIYMILVK